ncbi:amidohydrolase [Leptolyngbya sp. 7M]|uniref:amidohydrolase n=1 Tax=Leptolyngbya sp. 7M TaxID=2812896 RepID=UPI001B8BA5A4|nr:amidohydrolase [Leptolyngbya sp. 7M]QYO66711.1 amidohydrolase [Leptolyngbya sp. 7M]
MKKILLIVPIIISAILPAHSNDISAEIDVATSRLMPKIIEWRRHIHQHPELGNRELKTARYVEDHLRRLGIEVRTGIAKTGVVGILKGSQPGPVIGLRADMDGLPVTERNDLPFRSRETAEYNGQTVGVMHACGHDTHVAMLMGAAEVIAGLRNKLKGTVVFIFQPAEEGPPAGEEGGAELMVKEGVMNDPKIDAIFGLHINSRTEVGTIKYKPGSIMAASDWFEIKIRGRQTHGAYPWLGTDPIAVAAQIYTGLQMIVARRSDLPKAPVVITVGRINGGVRENIIPEELTMAGTIRTLDAEMQKDVHSKIRQVVKNISESMGATAEVSIDTKAPVTHNTPELVEKMLPSLYKAAGKENVLLGEWVTGAEDFSFFQSVPSFYFTVGGMPKGMDPEKAPPHHTPDFYIDDSRLDVGVKAFANIVFDFSK